MKRGRPGKLSPSSVRVIRRWYRRRVEDSTAAMCRRYKVSRNTLYAVGQRLAYKEIR
jgi:hypothetical protein